MDKKANTVTYAQWDIFVSLGVVYYSCRNKNRWGDTNEKDRLKEYGIHWPKEACNYVALKTAGNAYHIQGEINNIIACRELI